ncbi:response regulator [Halobacteriovorax sp. HLS]|uniref:response regulator n=1 Tax=Halobacteriovorax sp. HLS TaxID=2234000 RepID=UPI000FD96EFC|nr:response regulator [Halobacteriovorax sp. HLS]
MQILVIEDELLIQKSLKKLLEKKGASVDVSSTGKLAIDMLINNNYDRIICDLMLQDITGFDIIEESKKKYSIEEISSLFIIMTAYSSPQILEKAKSYGCKVLSKPFEDIQEAIEIFIKK